MPELLGLFIGNPSFLPKYSLSSLVAFYPKLNAYHSLQSVTLKNLPNDANGFNGML